MIRTALFVIVISVICDYHGNLNMLYTYYVHFDFSRIKVRVEPSISSHVYHITNKHCKNG